MCLLGPCIGNRICCATTIVTRCRLSTICGTSCIFIAYIIRKAVSKHTCVLSTAFIARSGRGTCCTYKIVITESGNCNSYARRLFTAYRAVRYVIVRAGRTAGCRYFVFNNHFTRGMTRCRNRTACFLITANRTNIPRPTGSSTGRFNCFGFIIVIISTTPVTVSSILVYFVNVSIRHRCGHVGAVAMFKFCGGNGYIRICFTRLYILISNCFSAHCTNNNFPGTITGNIGTTGSCIKATLTHIQCAVNNEFGIRINCCVKSSVLVIQLRQPFSFFRSPRSYISQRINITITKHKAFSNPFI